MPLTAHTGTALTERDRYVERVVHEGSTIELPELRGQAIAGSLYHIPDRCGLGVTAVTDGALDARQRDALERFRFAQYLGAGFIDKDLAFEARRDHDSLGDSAALRASEAVHFVVFAASSGRLLGTMCLLSIAVPRPDVRMADRDRPLFPLEEHFGWGPFNRLALLPDTPLEGIREFGRMVKNRRAGPLGAGPRPAVELCLAATRVLVGPLAMTVDACIGEFETRGVRRNLEYFHTPMVVLDGGLPVFADGHPLNAALEGRDRFPFAFLVTDLASMASRLDAIEAALAQPDPSGLAALAALQTLPSRARSSLRPPGGIPALSNTALPQASLSLPARRQARLRGRELSRFAPLASLSETESTTLRTLMSAEDVKPGSALLAHGAVAEAMLFVEAGEAEVHGARTARSGTVGAGDVVGAAGVIANVPSAFDVIARTPMRVLSMSGDVYRSVVRELSDVDLGLHRSALDAIGP